MMEPDADMDMPGGSHLDTDGQAAPLGVLALVPLLVLRRRRSTQR